MQKAFFALSRNSRSHELLIILACYICIGFGDTAELPFLGPKKREENGYAKETKQREELPDMSPPMLYNL